MEGRNRIRFAHELRGLAALCVVAAHFCGLFWHANRAVSAQLGIGRTVPWGTDLGLGTEVTVALGQIGVGAFFVISGFVIPFAFEREGAGLFAWRRALRIYSTYVAGLVAAALAAFAAVRAMGGRVPFDGGDLVSQATILLRPIIGTRMIDGVVWTLEIELLFYLSMLVLGGAVLRRGAWVLFALCLALAAGAAALAAADVNWFVSVRVLSGLLIVVGIGLFRVHRGTMSVPLFGLLVSFAIGSIAVGFDLLDGPRRILGSWALGYALGAVLVLLAARYWDRLPPSRVARHFADISYPLYASHSLPGYAVLAWMTREGFSPVAAITTAFAVAYLLALAIHHAVERPCLALARHGLAKRAATA